MELYIRIQIRTIQLPIFTEKFSPLTGFEPGTSPVPSRYATNWAILAWINLVLSIKCRKNCLIQPEALLFRRGKKSPRSSRATGPGTQNVENPKLTNFCKIFRTLAVRSTNQHLVSAGKSWSKLPSHNVIFLHWSYRLWSVQIHNAATQKTNDR